MALTTNAPKRIIFIVSLVLAVLAIAGKFTPIPYASAHGFWVMTIAYIVLALGSTARNF